MEANTMTPDQTKGNSDLGPYRLQCRPLKYKNRESREQNRHEEQEKG